MTMTITIMIMIMIIMITIVTTVCKKLYEAPKVPAVDLILILRMTQSSLANEHGLCLQSVVAVPDPFGPQPLQ